MPSVASARYRPAATAKRMPCVAPNFTCLDLASTRFSAHSKRGMNRSMVDLRRGGIDTDRKSARRVSTEPKVHFPEKGATLHVGGISSSAFRTGAHKT